MKERLQKIIAARGITSRRRAEELIRAGRVRVDGIVASIGDTADPELAVITVDGEPLAAAPGFLYLMLHKPRGYVTTMDDEQGRKTAYALVRDCGERVFPVGRLDLNSEGLLLFTNDGDFANHLMHPKNEVEKAYLCWVNHFSQEKLDRLRQMQRLDDAPISSPKVRHHWTKGETALLEVTIHEGKNRQIRRMCSQAELSVTRLCRIREGAVALGDLPLGTWRPLTQEEVLALKST